MKDREVTLQADIAFANLLASSSTVPESRIAKNS
jgi:hypothetical protein